MCYVFIGNYGLNTNAFKKLTTVTSDVRFRHYTSKYQQIEIISI